MIKINVLVENQSWKRYIKNPENYLKKTDIIHFRAPTGFGVLFLPWIYIFWSKKIWIKYGGSWNSNNVPITYKFQRWLLLHFSKNATTKKT